MLLLDPTNPQFFIFNGAVVMSERTYEDMRVYTSRPPDVSKPGIYRIGFNADARGFKRRSSGDQPPAVKFCPGKIEGRAALETATYPVVFIEDLTAAVREMGKARLLINDARIMAQNFDGMLRMSRAVLSSSANLPHVDLPPGFTSHE